MSRREVPATFLRPPHASAPGLCESCGAPGTANLEVQFGVATDDWDAWRICGRCAARAYDNLGAVMRRIAARAAETPLQTKERPAFAERPPV